MPEDQLKFTTPGDVFAYFRTLPEMQEFVEACYYDDPQVAAQRFYRSAEFAEVKAFAAASGKHSPGLVLDLGGGNGMATLAWKLSGYETVLLEPDPNSIVGYGAISPLIQPGVAHPLVCSAVGERLPFPNEIFDIVYTRQVLHHIPDLDAFNGEIYRVLKPGGLHIATREHVISTPKQLTEFLAEHIIHRYVGGENAYPAEHYIRAIHNAGFRTVQVRRRWESAINFYPMTPDEVRMMVSQQLGKWIGSGLAERLLKVKPVYTIILRALDNRDHLPGRLYSFFAVK